MPLPSNTTISISQIRTELGTSNGSLRALSALAGKSTPDAMSEFWGYSNVTYSFYGFFYYFDPCAGGRAIHTGSNGRWYSTPDIFSTNYTDATGELAGVYQDFNGFSYFYQFFTLNPGPSFDFFGNVSSFCGP
jgi:hypothetical protein